jgi:hypothetical protein
MEILRSAGEMRRSLGMITPRDVINLIRPLQVYTNTENSQNKNELLVKRTHYIYTILDFMVINIF